MTIHTQTFSLSISYSQICVFWSSLQNPFNFWTQAHVAQGFAWRRGSVSFRTLVESGIHAVEFSVVDSLQPLTANAIRAIEVPFEAPVDGCIEIASISDSIGLSIPEGTYILRCEFLDHGGNECKQVRLTLATNVLPHFAVLRADAELTVGEELITDSEAAT